MNDDRSTKTRPGFAGNYLRGLRSAAHNNASAYGYSVTITATFGILSVVAASTSVFEIFAFAGGAVLAYALVDGVASGGFKHGPRDEEPSEVTALGSSISFVSVGVALGVALVEAQLVGGWVAWPLGAFSATVAYLLLLALEIGLAERAKRGS
jgi:threonine/homoserine/homoserine lactone efflux protein